MLLAGTDQTDEVSHQILGLLTKKAPDGTRNPYYDRVAGTGPRDHRLAERRGFLAGAYHSADARLGLVRKLTHGNPDILASSDHGFAPQWYAIDAALPLKELGLQSVEQSGNCRATADLAAKECEAGATAQIYLNMKGRQTHDPASPDPGVLDPSQYKSTVAEIVDKYKNLTDPNTGKKIIEAVYTKAQMADIEGSDSLNPTRTGDVVVVAKVPYQFDAATPGTLVAPSQFFGQHGYRPNDVDLAHNINMHATFVGGGPDIVHRAKVKHVHAVDLAPTLAVLGHFDPPLQTQGKVLTNILKGGGKYRTGQILGINDVHGNITGNGLTETDPYTGVKDAAGGIATLATYLKQARHTNKNTVTVEAGDMVGASPPESGLLRDKPTLDALNKMGIDVGTLGNHEFDRGVKEMLRQVNGGTSTVDHKITFHGLNFPVVDANVISNKTGRPLLRPYVIKRVAGVKRRLHRRDDDHHSVDRHHRRYRRRALHRRGQGDQQVRAAAEEAGCALLRRGHPRGRLPGHLPGRDGGRSDPRHRLAAEPCRQGGHLGAQPQRRRHARRVTRWSSRRRPTPARSTTCTCCSTRPTGRSRRRGVRCRRRGRPRPPATHRSGRQAGQARPRPCRRSSTPR